MRAAHRTTGIIATLAAGLLAAGCASSHSSSPDARTNTADPGSSVPAWYAAGGATLTNKLGADLALISADATSTDTAAMRTHCAALTRDAGAAANYPPIPDPQAQQHWAAALDNLTTGSRDCSHGAATGNTALLAKSSAETRTAGQEMAKVTAQVNALGAQT